MALSKRILIVEDESSLRYALKDKFQARGFKVLQASDGQNGLKKALIEKPDLILLDLLMPVMDGETMLRKLREDSWGKSANVIVLTNLSDTSKMGVCLELGAKNYFLKSDSGLDELVGKVEAMAD